MWEEYEKYDIVGAISNDKKGVQIVYRRKCEKCGKEDFDIKVIRGWRVI